MCKRKWRRTRVGEAAADLLHALDVGPGDELGVAQGEVVPLELDALVGDEEVVLVVEDVGGRHVAVVLERLLELF